MVPSLSFTHNNASPPRPSEREKNREVNFSHTPHFISPVQQAAQAESGAIAGPTPGHQCTPRPAAAAGESRCRTGREPDKMTHTGDAAAEEGRGRASIEDRWSNVQSAVGTSISSGGKEHHRPSLTPSHYGRCSAWGASADGCSTPPPSSPKSAAVDQPERAKSNQCDQSPTSIAFSGATVTDDDDDAVAHIIFYGSLSWLSNTCRWAAVGLRAISTLRSQKTDPVCL